MGCRDEAGSNLHSKFSCFYFGELDPSLHLKTSIGFVCWTCPPSTPPCIGHREASFDFIRPQCGFPYPQKIWIRKCKIHGFNGPTVPHIITLLAEKMALPVAGSCGMETARKWLDSKRLIS